MTIETDDLVENDAVLSAQVQPEVALLEEYKSEITLRVSELPSLKPRVLPTRSRSRWRRFIEAGQRRTFSLSKNFYVEVEGEALPPGLQGRIVIPPSGNKVIGESDEELFDKHHDVEQGGVSQPNIFDGASIPFPWLVSYLSFGVLRPLGILLAASVVHDFAFQFGYLPIIKNGKCKHVPVQRHEADELFRLITQTLNGSNFFSRLAWHAVRLGWWAIKYAGQRFTGEPPVSSTILALTSVAGACVLGMVIRKTWLADLQSSFAIATALLGILGIAVALVYLWIAIESYFRLPDYYKDAAKSDNDS